MVKNLLTLIKRSNKGKIFCIGRNKTGTTSIKIAAEELGLKVGNQSVAEKLFKNYMIRDFKTIIQYCKTADFFQDIPFNLPYTYQILDFAFPESKFILSIRNSPEEWIESFLKFQTKVNGKNGSLPTKEELLENNRVFPGFAYWTKNEVYRTPDNDLYNRELLINHYNNFNDEVQHYFRFKKNLLIINVAEKDSYKKFCNFLKKEPLREIFPWENKT